MQTERPVSPLRLIFMGTAPLAAESLKALLREPSFQIMAVVTQPDRPKGRDLKLQPSAVKVVAQEHALPILQPERARQPGFLEELRAFAPDLIVVAAYGQILPQSILDLPRHGCLNVHTSILPRYRGAAPIQWAILNGDAETGVTLMKMDAGLDTGDILKIAKTPITDEDDSQTLHDRLALIGAELLVSVIPEYVTGRITPVKQPADGISIARKITKDDGRIDWTQSADFLWHRVRGLTPWPGAYTFLSPGTKNRMIKIWKARLVAAQSGGPGEIIVADRGGITVRCGT
ncbi:MAG TPA: methionyl-tRNA formyltransferase, partial [Roseimicrobium sp.]|nr:methionyl-tRNA formyltransferase [Roseimicrobium sp.]